MKAIKDMTQLEIGALVCSHLKENGIQVVLSGGASVSLYSNNKYLSKDLDLVDIYSVNRRKLKSVMNEIGFTEKNRYFQHVDSPFIVEFPPGPLTVGEELVTETTEIEFSTGSLTAISAIDCVKDRLAAYYHWGDSQSLDLAVLVASENDIDIDEIKRWSSEEGKSTEFHAFEKMLPGKK
jgi:hypothetical protein